MKRILLFIKREPVLVISVIAAAVSCFFVPPDRKYADYVDFRTLALLFSLMVVVAGLRKAGVFSYMAVSLCSHAKNSRSVGVILVCLCFFSSMLVTNDVALLTFVPFSVVVLEMEGRGGDILRVVVLETVAANLGSILTPVGNPQNLYLYSHYGFSIADFLSSTFPVWSLSLILLLALCQILPKAPVSPSPGGKETISCGSLRLYLLLFVICLATVIRVLDWPVMLAAVVVTILIFDRKTLLCADLPLLLTFVAFFVFAGNLARIDDVDRLLRRLMDGREYLTALLSSQVISNVPAALLLSGFTSSSKNLLLGVNIGGLGTPIASLASLISLKLYSRANGARVGRYLVFFTVVNAVLLLLLSGFWILIR